MNEKAELTEHSFRSIVDNLHEGLYFVDLERTITYWNKAAEEITGYTAKEVVGSHCHDNILNHIDGQGNQLCFGMCPLAATMENSVPADAEVYLHHKSGHRVPVAVRVSPLTDSRGQVIGGVELFSDISNRSATQLKIQELEALAFIDRLTGLANRAYLDSELLSRLDEHKRYGVNFGLLFMDIDCFKSFNDRYGHDLGDRILKIVADTFLSNSRPFDTFGRWGGEEFVGIIRNVDAPTLTMLGERLREAVAAAYTVHGGEVLQVTISLGATLVAQDDSPETVTKRADRALYESKTGGRNRLTWLAADPSSKRVK